MNVKQGKPIAIVVISILVLFLVVAGGTCLIVRSIDKQALRSANLISKRDSNTKGNTGEDYEKDELKIDLELPKKLGMFYQEGKEFINMKNISVVSLSGTKTKIHFPNPRKSLKTSSKPTFVMHTSKRNIEDIFFMSEIHIKRGRMPMFKKIEADVSPIASKPGYYIITPGRHLNGKSGIAFSSKCPCYRKREPNIEYGEEFMYFIVNQDDRKYKVLNLNGQSNEKDAFIKESIELWRQYFSEMENGNWDGVRKMIFPEGYCKNMSFDEEETCWSKILSGMKDELDEGEISNIVVGVEVGSYRKYVGKQLTGNYAKYKELQTVVLCIQCIKQRIVNKAFPTIGSQKAGGIWIEDADGQGECRNIKYL